MKLGKNFDNLGEICGELMISAVSSWYLRWALQFLSYSSNAGLHIHCRDSLKRLNPSQYPHSSHDHCRDSPSLSWYLVQRLTPSLLFFTPVMSTAETQSPSSIFCRGPLSLSSALLQRLTLSLNWETQSLPYHPLQSCPLQRLNPPLKFSAEVHSLSLISMHALFVCLY